MFGPERVVAQCHRQRGVAIVGLRQYGVLHVDLDAGILAQTPIRIVRLGRILFILLLLCLLLLIDDSNNVLQQIIVRVNEAENQEGAALGILSFCDD